MDMDVTRSSAITGLSNRNPWLGKFVETLSAREGWITLSEESVDELIRGFRGIDADKLKKLAESPNDAVSVLGVAPAWMALHLLGEMESLSSGFLLSSLLTAIERLDENPDDTCAQIHRDRIVTVYRAEVVSSMLRLDRLSAAVSIVESVSEKYGGL